MSDGLFVTWKALGTGHFVAAGAVTYRGAICYITASTKLAQLNGMDGLFEFEVDASGNTNSKLTEWK